MIPVKKNIVNESSGVLDSVRFRADEANFKYIFDILRSQLYSDPELAVIREYSTNAMDAHIMSGQPTKPIRVVLPTSLDCNLKIRDFGKGLSDQEIKDTFASYAASTKRGTQDATGMLGIGSKSGFAYNDSFLVNSYQNGKMTTWNAYIDPSDMGDMAKMIEIETTEPDGLEIVIPVKNKDIEKFHERATYLFKFFAVLPEIVNLNNYRRQEIETYRARKCMFSGDTWKYFGDQKTSYCIMGNIPYPLDTSAFGPSELTTELLSVISGGIHITFKIGELQFSANRESLQYTDHTKKAILKRLLEVQDELVKEVTKKFESCKTLWAAKAMYDKVFSTTTGLYHLKSLFVKHCKFNGQSVTSNHFNVSYDLRMSVTIYNKSGRYHSNVGNRVKGNSTRTIIAEENVLIVRNDKSAVNGIMNRMIPQIEGGPKYSKVYLLAFASDEKDATAEAKNEAEFIKMTGFDGPIVNLSTLPKESISKYYPNLSTGTSNPKHASKEFVYTPQAKGFGDKYSDFWTIETMDPATDSGVYLAIDQFAYSDKNGSWTNPRYLREILERMGALGMTVPKVYGFKKKSLEIAQKNTQMETLWDYIKKNFFIFLKQNPNLEQDFVDRKNVFNQVPADHVAKLMSLGFKANSPLTAFLDKYQKVKNATPQQTAQHEAFEWFANFCGHTITAKPKINLNADYQKIRERYPLVVFMAQNCGYHFSDAKKMLVEHIVMTDLVTP